MMNFYPGDPAAFFLARLLLSVCVVCGAGLLAATALGRNYSARDSVLRSALVCSLLLPGIVMAFEGMGVSLLSLSWLPAETPDAQAASIEIHPPDVRDPADRTSPLSFKSIDRQIAGERNVSSPPMSPEVITSSNRPVGGSSAQSLNPSTAVAPMIWRQMAGVGIGIWLVGSLFSLSSLAWISFRLSRIAGSATVLPHDRLRRIVTDVEGRLGGRKTFQVAATDKVPGPLACGLFRPTILLPRRFLNELSDANLCDVLTHEAAHLLRRDPLILWLQRLGGSLYWPIPFIHLLNRQLSRTREEVCDNHVLSHRDPIQYSETLLRVAELVCFAHPVRGANSMLPRTGRLERRIANLLDERRNKMTHLTRGSRLLGFSLLFAASGLACGIQIVAAPADPPNRPNNSHRVVFKPLYGMETKSSWTELGSFPRGDKKPDEQLTGRLTLQGEIPVKRKGDKQPIFKIKLIVDGRQCGFPQRPVHRAGQRDL